MALPDFLIIGAQKAGSSWLAKNLAGHPDVFMPAHEVHFFNIGRNFDKGIQWYSENFSQAEPGQIIGEKTPNYLWTTDTEIITRFGTHLPHIPRRIYETLPSAKLIITLRNPVERAISAVNHYMTHGQISPQEDINEVLVGKKQALAEQFGVFDMGKYFYHIEAYRQYFSPEQLLTLIFEEDIVEHPKQGLQTICEFLQIDATFEFGGRSNVQNRFNNSYVNLAKIYHYMPFARSLVNRLKQYVPESARRYLGPHVMGKRLEKVRPTAATLQFLYDMYSEDNDKLFQLMGRSIKLWQPD